MDAAGYVCSAVNDGGVERLLSALRAGGWGGGDVEGVAAGVDLATALLALLSVTLTLARAAVERVQAVAGGAGGAGAGAQALLAVAGRAVRAQRRRQ